MMLPPRAYIFIGLNAVRALSIISMILVFASSIFVLVTDIEAVNHFMKNTGDADLSDCDYIEASTVPNQPAGVFWAVVNRLLIIFQIVVLILSEIGWPSRFFDRFFPVLGPGFGLGALGIFQCLISASILSHHVDDFTLVAAFFLFSLGCVNMLLGLIFREGAKTKRSIFGWKASKKGILPTVNDLRPPFAHPGAEFVANMFTGSSEKSGASEPGSEKAGYGFGTAGEKKAGLKGFLISKPLESLPRYAPSTPPQSDEPRFKSSNTTL